MRAQSAIIPPGLLDAQSRESGGISHLQIHRDCATVPRAIVDLDDPTPCANCGAMPIGSTEQREWEFVPDRGPDGRWELRQWVSYSYPCTHWVPSEGARNTLDGLARYREYLAQQDRYEQRKRDAR